MKVKVYKWSHVILLRVHISQGSYFIHDIKHFKKKLDDKINLSTYWTAMLNEWMNLGNFNIIWRFWRYFLAHFKQPHLTTLTDRGPRRVRHSASAANALPALATHKAARICPELSGGRSSRCPDVNKTNKNWNKIVQNKDENKWKVSNSTFGRQKNEDRRSPNFVEHCFDLQYFRQNYLFMESTSRHVKNIIGCWIWKPALCFVEVSLDSGRLG